MRVGDEGEVVLIFDGIMEQPDALVALAAEQASFSEQGAGHRLYPGLGAPAPAAYVQALVAALDRPLRQVFGLEGRQQGTVVSRLSLVTRQPGELHPLQRVPHVDTANPLQFAILHYLCDERFGGTGFFRHRATGFETITDDRVEAFADARNREITEPGSGYITGDTAYYQRIGQVEARLDRLVVYRSCLLHSGLVADPALLSDDPRRGRLTANIFLTYQ